MQKEMEKTKISWALYKKKEDEESGGIFDYSTDTGEKLEPLTFSNKKTQETVTQEIKDAIDAGNNIIFVHGVCGTGKSAIALNLATQFKKTSIVVPIKSLQDQYEKDYTKNMFIMKPNNKPLSIAILKGRNNFSCEYDTTASADNNLLPCTIELREKNTSEILRFIGENEHASVEDFTNTGDVRRMNVAPACPYWSPVMPADINPKFLGDFKKIKYESVSGKDYAIFKRKPGCPYYAQYESYAHADVLIFNASKYLIENDMGRKPKTDIEIIDECDEFLDSFANEKKLNIHRLISALSNLNPADREKKQAVKELITECNSYIFDEYENVDCEKINTTNVSSLVNFILKNPNLAEDEEFNYYNTAVDIARSFENILSDTYVSIEKVKRDAEQDTLFRQRTGADEQVYITLVSINLAEKFKELLARNKTFVMMSGTLHTAEVLKDIFGLEKFKIIEAETHPPGDIKKYRTGIEKNCSYAQFRGGAITRDQYLKILDNCVGQAQKPALIHVNAFMDLPTGDEKERLHLDNLISQDTLKDQQKTSQYYITKFVSGTKPTLFTTKCGRGIDFPGDKCKSIIMTRYPYPNISGLFWKILKKEQPDKFMEFYLDKARRELIQKVARGVRFTGDSVEVLSPDVRVLNAKLH